MATPDVAAAPTAQLSCEEEGQETNEEHERKKSFKRLRKEFRKVSSPSDLPDFMADNCDCLWNRFAELVAGLLLTLEIIPIAMIVIGALNVHNCPVNPKIPVWMIVTGSVALVRGVISLASKSEEVAVAYCEHLEAIIDMDAYTPQHFLR